MEPTEVTIYRAAMRSWEVTPSKKKVVRHEETIKKLREKFTGGVRVILIIKPLCSFF